MLVGLRSSVAMLQFVVSRARAHGSHAMLCDAYTLGVSRSGCSEFVSGVELCSDDRRTDSSLIGIDRVTGTRHVARTRQFATGRGCVVAPLLPPNLILVPKLR